ncbi:hypothetical protein BKH34_02150 [Actinomyces naeslundii]|nr:hypothetical protein BKH34_02150 [Actinomyces naeslundii]
MRTWERGEQSADDQGRCQRGEAAGQGTGEMGKSALCSGLPGLRGMFWVHALRVRADRPQLLRTSSVLWKTLSESCLW